MAEAVVSIVTDGIESLGNFIIQQAKFLGRVTDQVEHAQIELLLMKGFLKDADARQGENEVVRIWVRIIRDAAYDLEDFIECFALKVASRRKGRTMKLVLKRYACILNEGAELYEIGSEIERITTKLSKLRSSMQSYNILQIREESGGGPSFFEKDDDQVGQVADVEILVTHLVRDEQVYQVFSICGMGGSGKTTIAKKVYFHGKVRVHFDCFAWWGVSSPCQGKYVLQEILSQLIATTKEQREQIAKMEEEEIAEKLCMIQRERKCLVVLDDIWTTGDWSSLKAGFPINENSGSRILITTRNEELADLQGHTNCYWIGQPIDNEEARQLFEKIAFSERHDSGWYFLLSLRTLVYSL